MKDRLLSTGQVSERTGAPEATLRYWRHRGIGPRGFKMGRRVVYPESEVDRWLAELAAADRRTPQPAA